MKTKKIIVEQLKSKLASDRRWAQRALLAIFKNQTNDEQMQGVVKYHNGKGFKSVDSEILTSFAGQLQLRGDLSEKQMAILHRKIPAYAGQLFKFHKEKIQASLS